MKKKILLIALFMLFLCPFEVECKITYDDIENKLFKRCEYSKKTFTVWSVGYTYPGAPNGGYGEVYMAVKRPENVDVLSVEVVPENFTYNGTDVVTNSVNDYMKYFANLDVETDGKIKCGDNDGNGYKNCKGNDYCNYYCSRAEGTIRLLGCDKKSGKLSCKINTKGETSGSVFFIYDNPGDGNFVESGNPFSDLNQILRGKKARTVAPYYRIGDEDNAITSIQSRSFKLYKSSLKNVKSSSSLTTFNCEFYRKLCNRNLFCKAYKNCLNGNNSSVSNANEIITREDTWKDSDGNVYDVFLRKHDRNSGVTFNTSCPSFSNLPCATVAVNGTSHTVTPYISNSFTRYNGGKVSKEVYLKDGLDNYYKSGNYEFTQANLGTVYGIAVKFRITYDVEDCSSCTVSDLTSRTSNECKDSGDTGEEILENKYTCTYEDKSTKNFDIISTDGGIVNTETDDADKINPFCYKSCNTKLKTYDLELKYFSDSDGGALPNVYNKAYKAGMGFDWDFSIGYERNCEIVIETDEDFYKSIDNSEKDQWIKKCITANTINSNTGSTISVAVDNFKYGYYNNSGKWVDVKVNDKTFEKLDLKNSTNNVEIERKIRYIMTDGTTKTSGDFNINNDFRKVSKVIYKEYTNGNLQYTTDEFGCVSLGDGKPIKCDESKKETQVESKTTYPIHPQMNSINKVPLYLQITLGNDKTITKECSYKVINELFGRENNPDDSKTNTKKATGLDVIYRPISLDNPFPGINGSGKMRGSNWSDEDVTEYISSNRGETTNNVYNKEPLYRIELDATKIKKIREYNKNNSYDDFKFICENGFKCMPTDKNILKDSLNYDVGTCRFTNKNNYYSCADKDASSGGENP